MGVKEWFFGKPVDEAEEAARAASAREAVILEHVRRAQYWFDHPHGFQCEVVYREPRERQANVGAFDTFGVGGFGLFGSVPVPFHGEFLDRGLFKVTDDRFVFIGQHCTRTVLFSDVVWTTWYDDGSVTLNYNGGVGVVTIQGPVSAAVTGALVRTGNLDPKVLV